MKTMDKKKLFIYIISILLLILLIISICPKSMQNDTFWSIKVGERLLNEGIFGLDTFSIHDNLYYIAQHFITDILIYIIYSFMGFKGLYLLEILLTTVITGLLYILNKEVSKNKIIAYFMTVAQIVLLRGFIAVRAQMISYILLIIELILLEKYRKNDKNKYIVGLAVIPIIIANFHMGVYPLFFVFLVVNIIGYFKIKFLCFETVEKSDKKRIKKLLLVLIIGIISSFINPYFIDGVLYPFKTFGNEFINTTIQEFKPYSVGFDGSIGLIYIGLITFIFIINKDKKIKVDDALLLAGTCFMSFSAIRYLCYYIICSYVSLKYLTSIINIINSRQYAKEDKKSIIYMFYIVFAIFSILIFIQKKCSIEDYIPKEEYPIVATQELKKYLGENSRVFNFYSWGSYLMLNNIKVYIDSRCDLYTKEYSKVEIADDYNKITECDKDYKKIIDKYKLNLFIIPSDSQLATLLNTDINFNKLFEDDVACVYSISN